MQEIDSFVELCYSHAYHNAVDEILHGARSPALPRELATRLCIAAVRMKEEVGYLQTYGFMGRAIRELPRSNNNMMICAKRKARDLYKAEVVPNNAAWERYCCQYIFKKKTEWLFNSMVAAFLVLHMDDEQGKTFLKYLEESNGP